MGAKNRGGTLELRVHWATAGGHHLSVEDLKELAEKALQDSAREFRTGENYLIVDTSRIKVDSGGKLQGELRRFPISWPTPKLATSNILPPDFKQKATISTTSPKVYDLKKSAVLFCRRPLASSDKRVRHKVDQHASQNVSSEFAARRGGVFIPWDKEGTWSSEQRVTCEPFAFNADKLQAVSADGLGIKVHLDFFSKVECTRSKRQGIVKLTIPHMDFFIETICDKCTRRNESCERKCGQHFISEVTIEVRPSDWAKNCREVEPLHVAGTFTVQSNTFYNVQATLPKQLSVGGQVQKGLAYQVPSDRWDRAFLNSSSKSVTWSWKFLKFAEGTSFKVGNTWRINSSRPLLEGNPSHIPVTPPVSASWDVRPEAEVQQLQLAWKMSIIVKTSVLKGKWPLSRLPVNLGYSVDVGPTIAFEGELSFA